MMLLKNGVVFSPDPLGERDILIGNTIERIDETIEIKGIDELDCENLIITPGFIDLHVHVNGAGGEGGPSTRTQPLNAMDLIKSGTTTVVGLLGTDGYTRSLADLLFHIRKLKNSGLNAFMLTGSYQVPGPTLTGSVARDILLINEVVGVKIALSDHRSSYPSFEKLVSLTSEARVSGMLSNKPGYVHVHMGDGKDMFNPIYEVIEKTDIPIKQFLPTHVDRNPELMNEAIKFAMKGGNIDITAHEDRSIENIKFMLSMGVNPENITLSTDGNGSMPKFDDQGNLIDLKVSPHDTILKIFQDVFIKNDDFSIKFLKMVTENPGKRLNVKKGRIEKGYDADLLVFDQELNLIYVIINGRLFEI